MSGISRLSGSHFHFHDIMPTEGAREPQPSTESAEPEAAGVEEGETEEEVSVEYFGERVLIAPPDRRANPDPQGVRQKAGGEVLNGQHAVRGTEVQGKGHFGLGALAPPITHEDVTMAQLALSAHELNPEPLPNGWREVTGDELVRLTGGLPTEVPATGFEAHLYIRETRGLPPEYVLAFRGTDNISTFNPDAGALDIARHRDLAMGVAALVVALEFETRDAWTNAINAAGRRAPQYEHAQAMARRISESIATLDSSVPGDIGLRYTGLSLGVGLATAAALATGHPATIFNPADVAATYVVDAQSVCTRPSASLVPHPPGHSGALRVMR